VTGESKELTEPWIAQHGPRYGYAYDPGGKLFSALSLSGYPSAVLVSPEGKIVWQGHPMGLEPSVIEAHLRGASRDSVNLQALTRQWPESARPVVDAVAKNKLGRALTEAARLAAKDPGLAGVAADLQRYVDARKQSLQALAEKRDYLALLEGAAELEKSLSGHARAAEFAALAKSVKSDKKASAVVSAQKQLVKLGQAIDGSDNASQLQAVIGKLHKLMKEHAGTPVEADASLLVSRASEKMRAR
jgi:hypothetical protein